MSTEMVEIWRATTVDDAYGDPVPGVWSKLSDQVARFAPSNPAEPVEVGRNAVITGGVVYIRDLPSVPDIRATDRAKVRGVMLDIDGEVGVWRRSSDWGVQFAVKAVNDDG